jgi:uncharacterized membrane protein YccC
MAPMALAAAVNPSLAAAPVTAAIVVLVPQITHASAVASALDRVIEVGLGGVVGLVVSFLLLPASAYGQALETAASSLEHMARALRELVAGLTGGLDDLALHRIQDGIGLGLAKLSVIAAEAERERRVRFTAGPDTGPLLRTLLRVRHDLVIVGRAAGAPLPPTFAARLADPLAAIGTSASAFLDGTADALLRRTPPPPLQAVDAALVHYARETVALREDGSTRLLNGEEVERFFAIGFAFEQMRANFRDLERCAADWAHPAQR